MVGTSLRSFATLVPTSTPLLLSMIALPLKRFRAKWIPVRVKKTRQNKNLELRSDSIGTEIALAHDPEKSEAVFRSDHAQTRCGRRAFARFRNIGRIRLSCPTCQAALSNAGSRRL